MLPETYYVLMPNEGYVRVNQQRVSQIPAEPLSQVPLQHLRKFIRDNFNTITRYHENVINPFEVEIDILNTDFSKLSFICWELRACHYRVGQIRREISSTLAHVARGKLNPRVREGVAKNITHFMKKVADSEEQLKNYQKLI